MKIIVGRGLNQKAMEIDESMKNPFMEVDHEVQRRSSEALFYAAEFAGRAKCRPGEFDQLFLELADKYQESFLKDIKVCWIRDRDHKLGPVNTIACLGNYIIKDSSK